MKKKGKVAFLLETTLNGNYIKLLVKALVDFCNITWYALKLVSFQMQVLTLAIAAGSKELLSM